jgi:hypothetical protein
LALGFFLVRFAVGRFFRFERLRRTSAAVGRFQPTARSARKDAGIARTVSL